MSQIKNAQIRYRIIDRCIGNKYKAFPSKQNLREACEEALFGSIDGDNICDSTIEKDLFAMRMDHDAPIKYSKRERGYYYDDENYSIDKIPLTSEDINAIQFAVKTLSQFRDVAMFQQFGNAIDKIVDRVSISKNPADEQIVSVVQFESGAKVTGNQFLPKFFEAIQNKKLVIFDYTSFATNKMKLRTVAPLLLKEYKNRWYLICEDQEKMKIITYALERMDKVLVTDQKMVMPDNFEPKNFFKHTIGITTHDALPEKILFKANNLASKYIQSTPFHSSQKLVKEGKKRTTFSLKVIITEELIRELLSYGGEVEVVQPPVLREKLTNRALDMVKIYDL
ncbi:MAG: putative DNA-binding transcriptional regulator YafY [Lentimonas sp.]|jgi:predicted DNA-binding transcriptional regulator YafY